MDFSIYSPEGLQQLARIVDDWCEDELAARGRRQNHIAADLDLGHNTLAAIRKGTTDKPDEVTIMKLGGHIPKPSGGTYTGLELLAIACGWEEAPKPRRPGKPDDYNGPNAEAVQWFRERIGSESLESVAKRCQVSTGTLKKIMNGHAPSIRDVFFLSGCLGVTADQILDLYGIDPDSPIDRQDCNGHDGARSAQC